MKRDVFLSLFALCIVLGGCASQKTQLSAKPFTYHPTCSSTSE